MFEPSVLVILAIFLPLVAAAAMNLFSSVNFVRNAISIISGILVVYIIYLLSVHVSNSEVITIRILYLLENMPLMFKLEPLGIIYAMLAASLWIITSIYSIGYFNFIKDGKQTRFFIFLSISIAFSIGIAFAGNLLTMLVFYEALTFATYPLVSHKGDQNAVSGARKYLGYLLGSSITLFIPAIIITYYLAGNMEFTTGGIFSHSPSPATLILLLLLFAYGIGKAALMPLHGWLPAAMVAPTPVSALLHAVAVVKAGVFCLIKVIVYIFGLDMLKYSATPNIIAYIAAFTIIAASTTAIFQNSLKKRLAYSTISQLAVIILAATILSQAGVIAAATHMAAHAVAKITLFFAAGAIIIVTSRYNISDLDGMGRKMPFVFICFFITSLSIIGLPGLAGGTSKDLITHAAKEADMYWIVYVLYGSLILNSIYFLPITYRAFFKKTDDDSKFKTPVTITIAIFLTTLLTLTFPYYHKIIQQLIGSI